MLRLRKTSKFRIGRNIIYAIIAITIISMIAAGSGAAAFSFKGSVTDLLGISPGVSSAPVRLLDVSADAPWTYTISPTTVSLGELTNFTVTVQSVGGNCGTNQMMGSFEMTLPGNFTLGTPTVVSVGDGSTFHHWLISASGQTVRTWALADGDKVCQDDILILNVPAMAISGAGTATPWSGMAYRNHDFTDPFPSDPVAGQPIVTVGPCVPPTVTTNPVDQTVTYGTTTVQFTSAATGSVTSRKWQVSTDGGLTFTDLVNNAPYSGVATGTLTITNPIYAMNGYRYHTVFTGFCEPTTLTTTDATLTVNKANATIAIVPYSVTFDGNAHTATGTATGAFGENLDLLLNLSGTTHTNAGTYPSDVWTFAGDANHLATGGTITDNISKAAAICTITGYDVPYDGSSHTATGACLGVLQETLAGLDLSGTTHTDAGNYPADPWIFTDVTGNYNNANGTVADNISQSTSVTCTVTGFSGIYDGTAHGATGECRNVAGGLVTGLVIDPTTYTNVPGGPVHWVFTNANYVTQSGDATVTITKANPVCTVIPYNMPYNGSAHTATGACLGVLQETLTGLNLTGTTHTNAGSYPADPWTFTDVTGNYNNTSGTVADNISQSTSVTCTVTGFSGVYDGAAHGATGSCLDIAGAPVAGLAIDPTTYTNVPGGPVHWVFTNANYVTQSGDATVTITKAAAICTVTPYNVPYDGSSHTATGACLGVLQETLAGLDLSGTTHTNAGNYPADPWIFTDVTGNYYHQQGTVADYIGQSASVICTVTGFTGVYDGTAHGATGECRNVAGGLLTGLVIDPTTYTNVPGGPVHWVFTNANYVTQSGDATVRITKANPVCTVIPYNMPYNGSAHTATGACLGVLQETLTGLNLTGTTHTNAGSYPADPWTFTDVTGNYNNTSGTVADAILRTSTVFCTITGYNLPYDGQPHTATGQCLGVAGETLAGLDLTGTTHTNAGSYPTDPWTFTDITGNYNNQSGTVADTITRSSAAVCTVTGYDVPFDALPHTATGQCLGVGGEVLAGLDLTGTTHTVPGTYPTDPWIFTDATGNYSDRTGTVVDIIRNRLTDLSITKTDGLTTVRSGDPVTYTIVVTNPGPAGVFGASVTDTFPGEFTGITWTCVGVGGGACPPNGAGNISVNVDLPVGASVTFTASGTVILGAQNSTLSNTSTVMPPPNMVDPNLANNTATDTTTVITRADLAITKTDNRTNLTPGDRTTYTIVVTNNGPVPAVNAIVTDNFPAGVIVDNWTCLRQNWAMCTLDGAGNINDVVYLPVGGILTYTATVTSNWNLTGQLVNTATVTPPSTMYDPILENNTSTDTDNFVVSISGNVKHFVEGGPDTDLGGVTLTLAGSNSGTATTNSLGNYTFTNLTSGGSWTVTPLKTNEVFEPTGRTITAATANVTGVDFIAHDWSSAFRNVFLVNTHAMPGNMANVPVRMVSQGTERTIMFSIDYPTNQLHEPTVGCGESTPGCNIVLDGSMPNKVGVTITVPTTLEAGLREIAVITFHTDANITVPNAPLTFSDFPVDCGLRDEINNDLPVTWTNGFVVFVLGTEGDVANRSSGDGNVLATDVVQMRRFVVGLDAIQPMYNEFQRADTAPYASFGDGQLLSADIVQARRYAARLDELTPAAGPGGPPLPLLGTAMRPATVKRTEFPEATRMVSAGTVNAVPGQEVALAVELEAFGNEVAAGFTVEFNAARLTNARAALAGDAAAAVLTVNMNEAEDGRIGILIDSAEPLARASEVKQLVIITFDVAGNAPGGETPIRFTDRLTKRGLSDELGNTLDVRYTNGTVMISGPIAYGIEVSGRVTTANGQGLRNAQVTITDSTGGVRTVITGTFGYYRFEGIAPAAGYTLSVLSRRFRFTPRRVTTDDDLTNVNLIAQE